MRDGQVTRPVVLPGRGRTMIIIEFLRGLLSIVVIYAIYFCVMICVSPNHCKSAEIKLRSSASFS